VADLSDIYIDLTEPLSLIVTSSADDSRRCVVCLHASVRGSFAAECLWDHCQTALRRADGAVRPPGNRCNSRHS
jgi:hypothetical protein